MYFSFFGVEIGIEKVLAFGTTTSYLPATQLSTYDT